MTLRHHPTSAEVSETLRHWGIIQDPVSVKHFGASANMSAGPDSSALVALVPKCLGSEVS